MASQVLCLVLLLVAAFLPTDTAGALLGLVTLLLVVGTVVGWIRVSALRKDSLTAELIVSDPVDIRPEPAGRFPAVPGDARCRSVSDRAGRRGSRRRSAP